MEQGSRRFFELRKYRKNEQSKRLKLLYRGTDPRKNIKEEKVMAEKTKHPCTPESNAGPQHIKAANKTQGAAKKANITRGKDLRSK